MKYCEDCGKMLIRRKCGVDGMMDYCETCQKFRFPWFNSAVSAVILNPTCDKILLIRQYGNPDNILVAGYINKGEDAKQTLRREILEETAMHLREFYYNDNEYYPATNTLMHNYVAVVDDEEFTLTEEVDNATWYSIADALREIKPNSLAQKFLRRAVKEILPKIK